MQLLKSIFTFIKGIFKFINEYFKSMIFVLIVLFIIASSGEKSSANLIEISLEGAIMDERELLTQIDLAKDPNIKGVLINIDSPGGEMSASVAISDAIKELSILKPVIAYASGTMASGSYYAGIGAHKIYANRASFIGSIGVIMQTPNTEELAKKIGISTQVVKAGEFKEAGTFTRSWNSDERAALQGLVDKSYELFTSDVANARGLDLNSSKQWANARVFLAQQALNLGLIDGIMSINNAKKELEILSGVATPIWYETPMVQKIINNIAKQSANLIITTLSQRSILWQW
ncbi:signal peptide peptidase SppA [Campylobacter devanensis]|uniref:signal peptide peptidase SppA n=1 Tax=Campylobacter devanensis TaxID=3161138 RepID=UPI000A330D8C|nr:signal peptide peptidase SppA [Campylobacter sp. P146]